MSVSTRNKLYKCDICGAQFSRSDSLKSHVRIHTGKSCDFKKHVCIHSEDKLQMCAQFLQSSYLKTHVRMYTGTYNYDTCIELPHALHDSQKLVL